MELNWSGKYDEDGRLVMPCRDGAPLETREEYGRPSAAGWMNRLILGESGVVLPSLQAEFGGKIDLVYIDPPFQSDALYCASVVVPGSGRHRTLQPAYDDRWRDQDAYLHWIWETAHLLRDLLAPEGSIYVHLDWHAAHHCRIVLDEVFGANCFQNEIVWCYREAINSASRWNRKHDTILFYTRDPKRFHFNANEVLQPHSPTTVAKYRMEDDRGPYRLMGRGIVSSPIASARDVAPQWEVTNPELVYRQYLREGTYPVDYWIIDAINQQAHERTGYPTQKPKALLERIIRASSNPGDLVLDCFCGSGTTAAAAHRLARRWIAADSGAIAIRTARKRLAVIEQEAGFMVQAPSLPGPPDLAEELVMEADPRIDLTLSGPTVCVRLALPPAQASPPPSGVRRRKIGDRKQLGFDCGDLDVQGAVTCPVPINEAPTGGSPDDWAAWIDCWAIDWNYDGERFRAGWHSRRAAKKSALQAEAEFTYDTAGTRLIMAKFVDVYGAEKALTLPVTIACDRLPL